jgi:hypothetical protein
MKSSLLILFILIGMAGAVSGPAGVVLQTGPADTPTVAISGINGSVFNASAFDTGPLGPSHYVWDHPQVIKQNNTPSDVELQNWSSEWIPLPDSFTRN